MAYQRWGKPDRFYVWMGSDGLHVWPPGSEGSETGGITVAHDQAGRDNAKAMLLGLVDLLAGIGIAVTARRGRCEFTKTEKTSQ